MRVGLTTTAIVGDLSGYFFGTLRDKASSIIWQHATPSRLVTDCKMNDLDISLMSKFVFSQHSVAAWMRLWSPLHKFE